jgi:hypothetical protein
MIQQRLDRRYVNRQKLYDFLDSNFGTDGYSVEVNLARPASISEIRLTRRDAGKV